jgi:multidrug efflux pump subunit AcrA (membrane-fusion protein)
MAIDDVSQPERIEVRQSSGPWVLVFVILGLLVIGEVYALTRLGSLSSIQAQQASLKAQMAQVNDQVTAKLASLEDANAQQLDALRSELDATSKKMKTGGGSASLARARRMVENLQKQTEAENSELKQEIAQQGSQMNQQMSQVTQDVSNTKSDLGTTKQTVDTLKSDLGMARSDMGTLIAKNHDDIETLRKLGQRNYYEFTLSKNQEQTVASVGLILKKTNLKNHRFNLVLVTNDMQVPKNGRTIDEPIFFSTGGSKAFYELVVNKVDKNQVTGYISTPKYSQPELAPTSSSASSGSSSASTTSQ